MGIPALGGEEKSVVLMLRCPKPITQPRVRGPFRHGSAFDAFKTSQRWPRPIIVSMIPLPRVFDTAIPYVFSMCSAPGDGRNPPVIAMATFRLSSFLSEERCPMERLHWQVA